ncbi:GFA family protein [Aureimonas populi]|uniref:GFA family protein n=1 Tax=Aureimonas populi TaxID=1701758 RepID=A0ABW5CGX2_9HYPH|nr:GFA family protein [Aureimonas populi]
MGEECRRAGACLCGSVRLSAIPSKLEMDVCHCSMCRRWSGGTFMAVPCGDSLEFESAGTLGVYRSSDYAERLFCTACGSTLAWRMSDGSSAAVAMHVFTDTEGFVFAEEIFIDEKPPHYSFANDTRKLTGAEVMAQFASQQGA